MAQAFRIGVLTPPAHGADPRKSGDFANLMIRWQLFETALRVKADGSGTETCLLEAPLRQEPGDGGRSVLSARVVPGRLFWDGSPVTAERIADSLRKTPLVAARADATAHEDRVFFALKAPNRRFDLVLADQTTPIVVLGPKGWVGTGPYVMEPGPPLRLRVNPHYRPRPAIEEALVEVYPPAADGQPQALVAALNEGKVDFSFQVPYTAYASLKNVRRLTSLGYSTLSLHFNTTRPALADARVRRALAAVVDRRAVTGVCYSNPLAFEARALLPAMLRQNLGFGFEGTIAYDPARAGRLLAESGARPPQQPLRLLVIPLSRPYLPDPQAIAARVAKCFTDIGWRVEADLRPNLAEYSAQAAQGAYDMVLQGWQPDSPDPLEFVAAHLWSTRIPAKPEDIAWAGNLARYRNPALDKAIETHRAERDARSWDEIQQVLVNEMPLLPIMYGAAVVMLSWRVTRRSESFLYRPLLAELAV